MKYFSLGAIAITAVLLCGDAGVCASEKPLPLVRREKTVALVNGEPVTVSDLESALALRHEATKGAKVSKKDTLELLQRLIDSRLAVQEARKIGLDQLSETRTMVDAYAKTALREQLMDRQVGKLAVPEKEAERLYKEAIREWKLVPVMFAKEDDAKKMLERLKAGEKFVDLAKSVVAEGTAKGGDQGQYVKVNAVNPEIAAVVSKMAPGSVSPIIPIKPAGSAKPAGYALVELEDIRQVDSVAEKEAARREALKNAKVEALNQYNQSLIKRYVVVHRAVLDHLDFEAKEPGFEKLLKDDRVLADIKGENPITVADLADQLRHKLFHGVEQAAENKKLNEEMVPAFDEMLYKRLFRKEALRLGLDKTAAYTRKVKEYENSLVFGSFVQKVLAPDVKLTEKDLQVYYEEHLRDYTFPEMMKILGIAFQKRADAEGAVTKLRNGTDFQWLVENAEGQADKNSKDLLVFDGKLVTTPDLPEGVRKVVSGSKAGDLRVYASPEGYFYALSIQEVVPSRPKPYEEAREEIAKKIFNERLEQAMHGYIAKLRAAADIKIFLKP
ncbi:MAG TPA: peptidyl-prolyl cis-trans isomerase [Syntrophorhabdales bacterium]|nr:peptidyl-prolyl cis-trans isomerase [Syntrophorhabdales bacterium]